jgi:uncharacterized repeat protein (TIGR01451 family)
MYRTSFGFGFGSVILAAGLIVALVRAQDETPPRPLIVPQATPAAASEMLPAPGRPMSSRRTATAPIATKTGTSSATSETAEPEVVDAGTQPAPGAVKDPAAGMRSVLKRPAGQSPSSAPRSATGSTESPRLGAPEPQSPRADVAIPEPPATVGPPPTRSVLPPASPSDQRFMLRGPGGDAAASSAAPQLGVKPVPARRVGGPSHPAGTAATAADAVVSSVGPLVRVDTKGPQAICIGAEATYVVTTANLGDTEAKEVTVRVALPAGLQLSTAEAKEGHVDQRPTADGKQGISWTVPRLPARAENRLTLKVIPKLNQPFELAVDWSMAPLSAVARVEVQQPMLQASLSGPSEIVFGETKVFSITLANPGTGDAKNVAVQLTLGAAAADTLKVGHLAAGESKSFDVEVNARDAGTIEIAAVATGDLQLQAEAKHAVTVLRANLDIEAAGPAEQFLSSVGTYHVRIVNTGTAVAKNVQVAVRLPRGAKYVKGLENAKQLAEALVWSAGDLAPNAERGYQFLCQLTTEGDNLVRFGARTEGGIETAGEVLTRVESMAELKLVVNDPKGPIPVGEEVTYELQVTNRGTKAAANVAIVAQFGEGIEPVSADGAKAEMIPGQVQFRPLSKIAPSETLTLKIKARAARAGSHLFRAEVKCADPETKLVSEGTTRYYGGDSLVKRPAAAGGTPTPADRRIEAPHIGSRPSGTIQR